jgi:hypothetical protein
MIGEAAVCWSAFGKLRICGARHRREGVARVWMEHCELPLPRGFADAVVAAPLISEAKAHAVSEITANANRDRAARRNYLRFLGFLFGVFGAILVLGGLFSAWWDISEDSMLPLLAAIAVLYPPLLFFGKRMRRPFSQGTEWAGEHVLQGSLALGLSMFVFLFVWGLIERTAWLENLAWSAVAAAGVFVVVALTSSVQRRVRTRRTRKARKLGVEPTDYKPGKRVRRIGLVVFILSYVLLFVSELSDKS